MSDEVLTMKAEDLKKLSVINKVNEKVLTQAKAAEILGCTDRTIRRLQKKVNQYGAQGILSKKYGKKSNKKYSDRLKTIVINLIRDQYYDFGPTLASEQLAERNNIVVSKETVRKWMIEYKIWHPKKLQRTRKAGSLPAGSSLKDCH